MYWRRHDEEQEKETEEGFSYVSPFIVSSVFFFGRSQTTRMVGFQKWMTYRCGGLMDCSCFRVQLTAFSFSSSCAYEIDTAADNWQRDGTHCMLNCFFMLGHLSVYFCTHTHKYS